MLALYPRRECLLQRGRKNRWSSKPSGMRHPYQSSSLLFNSRSWPQRPSNFSPGGQESSILNPIQNFSTLLTPHPTPERKTDLHIQKHISIRINNIIPLTLPIIGNHIQTPRIKYLRQPLNCLRALRSRNLCLNTRTSGFAMEKLHSCVWQLRV